MSLGCLCCVYCPQVAQKCIVTCHVLAAPFITRVVTSFIKHEYTSHLHPTCLYLNMNDICQVKLVVWDRFGIHGDHACHRRTPLPPFISASVEAVFTSTNLPRADLSADLIPNAKQQLIVRRGGPRCREEPLSGGSERRERKERRGKETRSDQSCLRDPSTHCPL